MVAAAVVAAAVLDLPKGMSWHMYDLQVENLGFF